MIKNETHINIKMKVGNDNYEYIIKLKTFKIYLFINNRIALASNDKSLLYFEQIPDKDI